MRYTEYHCGKAVIKDKALLSQAMQKLAKIEDKEEKQEVITLNNLTQEMKEYICDNLCQYPSICRHEEHLMQMCEECQIEEYVQEIEALFVGKENGDENILGGKM